jgi:hypothetical protein
METAGAGTAGVWTVTVGASIRGVLMRGGFGVLTAGACTVTSGVLTTGVFTATSGVLITGVCTATVGVLTVGTLALAPVESWTAGAAGP